MCRKKTYLGMFTVPRRDWKNRRPHFTNVGKSLLFFYCKLTRRKYCFKTYYFIYVCIRWQMSGRGMDTCSMSAFTCLINLLKVTLPILSVSFNQKSRDYMTSVWKMENKIVGEWSKEKRAVRPPLLIMSTWNQQLYVTSCIMCCITLLLKVWGRVALWEVKGLWGTPK